MQSQCYVQIAGQQEPRWLLEKDLLPKYEILVNGYKKMLLEQAKAEELKRARTRSTVTESSKPTVHKEEKTPLLPTPLLPPAPALLPTPFLPVHESKQSHGELPHFLPMSAPKFKWGPREAADFICDVNRAYEITTKWRKNVFKLPSGQCGKHFTKALTYLYESYGSRSPLESIALKAAAIITPLLLQQPTGKPTYRDNVLHLTRRLKLWDEGKIDELLKEGFTIQAQLVKSEKRSTILL